MRPFMLFFLCSIWASFNLGAQPPNPNIDFEGFLKISQEVNEYRQGRLVPIETFMAFAKEENTIILDCRSKEAYNAIHIKGAIHINFSDFTEKKLAEVIPDKNTRILIYCNNNFISQHEALVSKSAPLALNIPTFVNLYGYGYKNVYELSSYLIQEDPRLEFDIKAE